MGFQWDINWILIGYYWTIKGKIEVCVVNPMP